MAIAFVNSTGEVTASGITTGTTTTTLGWTPSTGNHLIVCVTGWISNTVGGFVLSSVSDGQSNTYAVDVQHQDTVPATEASISSAKVTSTGASIVVTLHFPVNATGAYMRWCVTEFSGLDTTTWLDKKGSIGQGNTANITVTATGANSQANTLVVAAAVEGGSSTNVHWTTPTTGYSVLYTEQSNVVQAGQASYKIVSGVETSSAAWTVDAPGSAFGNAAVIATYKASAGGVTPALKRNSSLNGLGASGPFFHDPMAMVAA